MQQEFSNRCFKFENAWLTEPLCKELVKNSWSQSGSESLQEKLIKCSSVLQRWGKNITGNFKERIKLCKSRIAYLHGRRDQVSVKQFKKAQDELVLIYQQKEIYWRQCSKQLWLQYGDANTKFFHAYASTRKKKMRFSDCKGRMESG